MSLPHLGVLQLFESTAIVALVGIDDPLETPDGAGGGYAGFAGDVGGGHLEAGFDAAQPAAAPLIVDEGIDEEAPGGVGRAVQLMVLGGEPGEIRGRFGEQDLASGINAVLQGIRGDAAAARLAASGLAFGIRPI